MRTLHLVLGVLLLVQGGDTFDFDDEEETPSSPSTYFDNDSESAATSIDLIHSFGDVGPKPRGKLFFKERKGVGNTGGRVPIRVSQARLESEELEAIKALAKVGGYYTISIPSVLSDPNSPAIFASASACALLASRFEEQLQLHMTSKDVVASLSYSLPIVPTRCPASSLPRLAFDDVLFNLTATQQFPQDGPKPLGKIHDAAFLPPAAAAAAAAARNQAGDAQGGQGERPPPENQSFMRKYWMYILPVVLILSMGGGEPPAEGGGGGGEGGGARPAARARR